MPLFAAIAPLLFALLALPAAGQERAVLAEETGGTASVSLRVTGTGTLVPRPGSDPLGASVEATYRFRARRVPVEGDGPTGRREVRFYDAAGSELTVGPQPTYARLRPDRRLIVATGAPRGVTVLCPASPLRYGELELLDTPLDPLLVGGLLPAGSVAAGETWEPADWVAPALAGVEAVAESSLRCELTALTAGEARGSFEGTVAGATDGASVRVTLAGTFAFDRAAGRVTAAELEQVVRSSPGPISPGADLKFSAKLTVDPAADAGPLTPAALAAAADAVATPEETAARERAELVTPWGPRAVLDRGWRFVNQTRRAAVLLRLENGRPRLAATLSPADAGAAGEPPDAAAFADSVRETLADRPGRIEREAALDLGDDPADRGRALLLVRVTGRDPADEPQVRDHYLLQNADGRRAEVVLSYPPDAAAEADAAAFPLLDALRWPAD